ncbi:hypothetical protein Rsl_1577 [Rickettsia slovaca 13-B]|uniref:Uncharacterized protein n=1 Tax=Rickettsia slovaca (strain 13-B) TaxID=941638 RepID=A0ABM5MQI0_RICS1|nr:hypothetical protein Rsl_1577 [Rickettsia slovaca 13-B]
MRAVVDCTAIQKKIKEMLKLAFLTGLLHQNLHFLLAMTEN